MIIMREFRGGGPVDGKPEEVTQIEVDQEYVGISQVTEDKPVVSVYRRSESKRTGKHIYYFYNFVKSVPGRDIAQVLNEYTNVKEDTGDN